MKCSVRMIVWVIVCLIILPTCLISAAHADGLSVQLRRDKQFVPEKRANWAVLLTFSKPVFSSEVSKHTKVFENGRSRQFKLLDPATNESADGAKRRFRVIPTRVSDDKANVWIAVQKGLSDASGRNILTKNRDYQFHVVETISVQGISTYFTSQKDKGLYIRLRRNISSAGLRSAIEIEPEMNGISVIKSGWRRYKVSGDFELGKDYVLRILPVPVNNGTAVLQAVEHRFKGPGIEADISFRTKRTVVELRSRQLVPLTLANLTKVRCRLLHIPPYLIPDISEQLNEKKKHGSTKKSSSFQQTLDAVEGGQDRLHRSVVQISEKLAKLTGPAAVFNTKVTQESEAFFAGEAKDHVYGYSMPLAFREGPEQGGAWLAELTDPDQRFTGAAKRLLQVTDLSVSYKLSSKKLLIWVTSLYTGKPVSDVEIMVCGFDGYRYLVGRTDEKGILLVNQGAEAPALFRGKEQEGLSDRKIKVGDLRWVIAATSEDACGTSLRENRLKSDVVQQTKSPGLEVQSRRGYVFTERGIYMPGETVHFKFVSRAYKDKEIVPEPDQRVQVEIVGPRKDIPYHKELTLNEFGSCHDEFLVKKFYPVGTYTLRVKIPQTDTQSDKYVTTFQVQEYKRPRHFVSLTVKEGERVTNKYVTLERTEHFLKAQISGQYYAGGPVKHAKVKWKAVLVPASHKVKGFTDYFFGNSDKKERFLESGESMLDEKGNLQVVIPIDRRQIAGLHGVKVSATVVDIDGEPATEVTTFKPKPAFQVGISRRPEQVQRGYSTTLKAVVLDTDRRPVQNGTLKVSLLQKEYFYTQKRDRNGDINYHWDEGWLKTTSSKAPIEDGTAEYELELNSPGHYMVAFTYEHEGKSYTSQTMFQSGWDQYDRWRHGRDKKTMPTSEEILVGLASRELAVGETAVIEFNTMRPVTSCLVTLEKDDILDYRVLDVNGTKGEFDLTAKENFLPNVYVSVIGTAGREGFPLYATEADTDVPTLYYGYGDIRIRRKISKLQAEIAPDKAELRAEPGEKVSLDFKVRDDKDTGVRSEIAVCVVDEAVLALTRFKTPNLSSLTEFHLPLSVFSGDLRLALLSQDLYRMFSTQPLTGGGAGFGLVESTIRKDFRPVAFFDPAVVTDKSGRAEVTFTLPDSTTAYRIYAVVCDKGSGFASAQRRMVVAKDFFIEPAMLRFLIPGDKTALPVSVHNQTDKPGVVELKAHASKDLKVAVVPTELDVDPNSISKAAAEVEVMSGTEEGMLEFAGSLTGDAGSFSDAIRLSIPILSRYLPVKKVEIGHFSRSKKISVELPDALKMLDPDDINPDDFKARLNLSTTNWNKISPGLKYLLRYPYGCVEQTSSGVIPLAGLRGLIETGVLPDIRIEEVDKFLSSGITRLLAMQRREGGFSYWPGRNEVSWWGTLYATFALTIAKQAGCTVPEDRLTAAVKYLRANLFGSAGTDPYHGSEWTRELALYCLAKNNALSEQEFEPFFDDYAALDDHAKGLLLLTAKEIGYLPEDKLARHVSRLRPKVDESKSGYYDSTFRAIAVCLMAVLESGSHRKKADDLAGDLIRHIQPEGRWYSTADTGWCLLALGQYYQTTSDDRAKKVPCKISYGGEKEIEVEVTDLSSDLELDPHTLLQSGEIRIDAEKKGLVNYTLNLTYPDLASDPTKLTQGLVLRKKIENLNGNDNIRVGDIVRVRLEIEVSRDLTGKRFGRVEYLALEDPVPAGLVPINSELETEGTLRGNESGDRGYWRDGFYELRPTYYEFRNDRVVVFKNRAWPDSYVYTYLARAVAQGDFWLRGSRVSLMYDPDVFGKTEGYEMRVLPAK